MCKKNTFIVRLKRQGLKFEPTYNIVLAKKKKRVQSGRILYKLGYYVPRYRNNFSLDEKKNKFKLFFFDFSIFLKCLLKDTRISYKVAVLISKLFCVNNDFLYKNNKNIFNIRSILLDNNKNSTFCLNKIFLNELEYNKNTFFMEKNKKRIWNYNTISYSFFLQVNETNKYLSKYIYNIKKNFRKKKKIFQFPTLSIFIKLLFNTIKFRTKNLNKSIFYFKKTFLENFNNKKIRKKIKYPKRIKYVKKKK